MPQASARDERMFSAMPRIAAGSKSCRTLTFCARNGRRVSERENGRSSSNGFSLPNLEALAPRRTSRTPNKKFTLTSTLAVRRGCFDGAPAQNPAPWRSRAIPRRSSRLPLPRSGGPGKAVMPRLLQGRVRRRTPQEQHGLRPPRGCRPSSCPRFFAPPPYRARRAHFLVANSLSTSRSLRLNSSGFSSIG
jgi:hypothetical protein